MKEKKSINIAHDTFSNKQCHIFMTQKILKLLFQTQLWTFKKYETLKNEASNFEGSL